MVEVLAAHWSMFVIVQEEASNDTLNDQDKNALGAYLQHKMMDYLQNWVNMWKPAIKASINSAQALSVDAMGHMDKHFSNLVPPPKCPPRSWVLPHFHTQHDGNRGSRHICWKAPTFVCPITKYFVNILQHMIVKGHTTPEASTGPPSPAWST